MSGPEQPPCASPIQRVRTTEERRELIETVAQTLGDTLEEITPGDMFVSDMLHAVAVFALGATTSMGCTPVELQAILKAIQFQIVEDERADTTSEPRGN